METIFQPRKELFRPCCGHCIFGMKRSKTNELGMRTAIYICKKSHESHSYGHICDVTATDDGEQLEINLQDICDGNYRSVTHGHN